LPKPGRWLLAVGGNRQKLVGRRQHMSTFRRRDLAAAVSLNGY
jgi:hypothetical protein